MSQKHERPSKLQLARQLPGLADIWADHVSTRPAAHSVWIEAAVLGGFASKVQNVKVQRQGRSALCNSDFWGQSRSKANAPLTEVGPLSLAWPPLTGGGVPYFVSHRAVFKTRNDVQTTWSRSDNGDWPRALSAEIGPFRLTWPPLASLDVPNLVSNGAVTETSYDVEMSWGPGAHCGRREAVASEIGPLSLSGPPLARRGVPHFVSYRAIFKSGDDIQMTWAPGADDRRAHTIAAQIAPLGLTRPPLAR